MKRIAMLSLASIVAATSAFAADQVMTPANDKFVDAGTVGPWRIYGDKERGTCLIEGVGADGNVVQMGLTKQAGVGYVGVFTKNDISGYQGEKKEMTIVVNKRAYTGPATQIKHGLKNGYVLVNNPAFVDDLKKGFVLVAWPEANDGAGGVVVDLKDSYKAIEAGMACNKKMAGM